MNSFDFQITPIITIQESQAISNIIEIDGLKLLFDCGWDETFSQEIKTQYDNVIKDTKIDHIFISNNYLSYFGALPIVMKYPQNKDTEIYATTPITKLGFYILADAYISKLETSIAEETFNDQDISKIFLGINEVKFQQTVKLNHKNNSEIILTPIPSGFSLGGCSWKISYKLHNWIYSPQYMIEPKLITDPFPYQLMKNVEILITDTLVSHSLSLKKTIIEAEFKKKIIEILDEHKNVFIPSDSVNITLDLLIRLEKLLDDYFINKPEKNYKVLVCGYCSNEIIEGVKSLIEFMGTAVSQQFYSYNDNPFNFQYITCIKDMTEYKEVTSKPGFNYFVIASFFSLSIGMSYQLLPLIFQNPDWRVLLVRASDSNSFLNKVCKQVSQGKKTIDYKQIIIIETKEKDAPVVSFEIDQEELNKESIKKENRFKEEEMKFELERTNAIRKKLFAKNEYPMFNYTIKHKYTHYGFELNEKEINQMKCFNQNRTSFQSSFKEFLDSENKASNSNTNIRPSELKVKLSQYNIPTKIDTNIVSIELNAKIYLFDLMSSIDIISKEYIITEINPKREVIFLGEYGNGNYSKNNEKNEQIKILSFDRMITNLNQKGIKSIAIPSHKPYIINFKENFLPIKFDSSILSKAKQLQIQDYGNIYVFKNIFLKVKRQRDKEIDISLCDNEEKDQLNQIQSQKLNDLNSNENTQESNLDYFYSKTDLKLIQIKRELEKVVNCSLFIEKQAIVTMDKSIKVMFKDGELTLEGEFSSDYMTLRNFIYSNYMDMDVNE